MTGRPVLNQFNLVVTDMDTTITFYRLLGLSIPETTPDWRPHHRTAEMPGGIALDFDSTEFAHIWDTAWSDGPRMGVLGFAVSSRQEVDDLYRTMTEAGYMGEQQPYDAFWGARYAVVQDPDGNPVGIMSPIDLARRSQQSPPPR